MAVGAFLATSSPCLEHEENEESSVVPKVSDLGNEPLSMSSSRSCILGERRGCVFGDQTELCAGNPEPGQELGG